MQKTVRRTKIDYCFPVLLFIALCFLLWKCRYGYGACDEPFYLTIVKRLADGDALLADEWNLSQLSGFLLLPFYKLYTLFTGSSTGIVLHFRYLYVLVQALVSVVIYYRLREYRPANLFAFLYFIIYTPYDIMALSYNTMGLMCMTLSTILLAGAAFSSKPAKRSMNVSVITAGVLYAAAVLCNPYLISVYLLYTAVGLILLIFFRARHAKTDTIIKSFLFFTLGAALVAALLALLIFSRAGFSEVFANLKELLNDPEHSGRSIKEVIYTYGYVMIASFKSYLAVWLVLLIMALVDRDKYKRAWMYFCMTALITAVGIMIHIPSIMTHYNYITFPIVCCGFTAFLLSKKKNWKVFFWMWLTGLLYTFCLGWASNQGDNAICMGMPVAGIASIIFICQFVREQKQPVTSAAAAASTENATGKYTYPLILCVTGLLFLAQFGTECFAKANHAFWESDPAPALSEEIKAGPLKGVRTSQEHAAHYNTLLSEIQDYNRDSGAVLFITTDTWCYLYAGRPFGTYSSWISTFSGTSGSNPRDILMARLTSYYALHPDRIPVQIYIAKKDLWDFSDLSQADSFVMADTTYFIEETEHGYHLTAK